MNEELELYLSMADENMAQTIDFLEKTLSRIRAGKASVRLLDGIRVDYYGTQMSLDKVSNLSTPDPKTIAIQPWEKNMIKEIEKAIMASDVGITPVNNGEIIRLAVPPLTEERRRQLTKQVKHEGEEAKISIRNTRRDSIDAIKKLVKDGLSEDLGKDAEAEIQKTHDKFIKSIDEMVAIKEKEIMTV
ncbi:MAG: ribosome recycling factor [Bacteroidales bacterium]|jgi:ribosome recycling factor|nr:ribosome recycling factor [Bacteroidales bacterium]MDD4639966.1 ribosome recycling factor [Bacteroidales bacterium]NLB02792.1 ribosome recycling factor [Bacteroidales bacterium]